MIKKTLQKVVQQSRIARYKTYKKAGLIGHRKKIDTTLLLLSSVCIITGFLVVIQPHQSKQKTDTSSSLMEEPILNPDAQETVHGDLGDEPVVPEETGITLIDLEKQAASNEIEVQTLTLGKNETLLYLLSQEGITTQEALEITDSLGLLIDLRTMKPGENILLFTSKEREFLGLALRSKGGDVAAVLKENDGSYTPYSQEGRVDTSLERIQGTIERTFTGSAQKAGVPQNIISQITGALDGEIDFSSDFHPNDRFEVIYEKKVTESGLELGEKTLLYIGLYTRKKEIHRYAYTDRSGTPSFYDPKGQTGQKALYKRPVKARPRLSSPYGWRVHPILMYKVFHSGVDLACPKNTPIIAAADGTITHIGRKGAYGKYIRIKHADGYQTAYGHMNGYRSNLKNGSHVKRGEVIGYVGSTGRSTGPHLHFEVWKNGKTVSPFGNNIIKGKQLKGFELEQFQSQAESVHPDFMKHLIGVLPKIPPIKPSFK